MHSLLVGRRVASSRFTLSSFTLSRFVLVPAIAVLLASPVSNAQAQFGKLKKLGADAIKDKAKEKIAGKEAPATPKDGASAEAGKAASSESKPVNLTITPSQLDVMLAALTPMAADAEKATQVRRLTAEHTAKLALAEKCLNDATQAMIASRTGPNPTAAAKARARQLNKEAERLSAVMAKAYETEDRRTGVFAQDSMKTLQMQSTVLEMALKCNFEFTPPSVMDAQVATFGMSGDLPEAQSAVPAETRTAYTKYQFALLRERIALFALSSADPTVKVGKEGVFTDEERAALTARAAEIQKLTPYFKNGTLVWKGPGDLSKW